MKTMLRSLREDLYLVEVGIWRILDQYMSEAPKVPVSSAQKFTSLLPGAAGVLSGFRTRDCLEDLRRRSEFIGSVVPRDQHWYERRISFFRYLVGCLWKPGDRVPKFLQDSAFSLIGGTDGTLCFLSTFSHREPLRGFDQKALREVWTDVYRYAMEHVLGSAVKVDLARLLRQAVCARIAGADPAELFLKVSPYYHTTFGTAHSSWFDWQCSIEQPCEHVGAVSADEVIRACLLLAAEGQKEILLKRAGQSCPEILVLSGADQRSVALIPVRI